jgi:putative membrane protein
MIAWLAILVAVILFVIRWMGASGSGTRTARDILDERFAKGEIDQDEYDKRRRALNT